MTDSEQPAFNVVDRRSAAQTAETAPAAPEAEDTSSHTASEETTFSPDGETAGAGTGFPDPAALLNYITMQMDVKTLASVLLGVFSGHAWRALGLVADPVSGQIVKNMPEAQLAIDCMQFLLGKVENDLAEPERREVQRRLNDLRMNYVLKLREE